MTLSDAVIIAITVAVAPTILAIATLIATIKGNTRIVAMEGKVNGTMSELVNAIATMSEKNKTIIVEGRRDSDNKEKQ